MFGLKIAFNGKNIMLGKGMDSLKKIEDELNNRFPGQFPHGVILKYQGNVISDYEQIQAIVGASLTKALKLEAEVAPPKKLSVITQQKVQSISDSKNSTLQNQQNQQKVNQPQVKLEEIENKKNQNQGLKTDEQIQNIPESAVQFEINVDSSEEQQKKIQGNQKVEEKQEKQKQQAPKIEDSIEQEKPRVIKCTFFRGDPKVEQLTNIRQIESHLLNQNQQENAEQSKNKNISNASSYLSDAIGEYVQDPADLQLKQVEPGVYQCIFCKQFQVCNVCETKRKLYPNSKFIKLVNVIVNKKLNEKIQQIQNRLIQKLSALNKIQKSEKKQKVSQVKQKPLKRQSSFDKNIILSNSFDIEELKAIKQVNFGEQFNWTFKIQPRKPFENEQKLHMIDERTGQLQNIAIKNDTQVLVGPFAPEKQGRFEKTYRLCLKGDDDSLQLFGPKFGFNVMITKPKNLKVLSNGYRQAIDQIRKAYKCEKSTEYLIEKLKQLGISEENYEQNKGLIPDIIQTV